MNKKIHYHVLRDEAAQKAVYRWWQRLHGESVDGSPLPSAARAMLRRAHAANDTLLTNGFRQLWFALPETVRKGWRMPAWGCVAAVLANVEANVADKSFAATLGAQRKGDTGKPVLSELRFSQLQHSRDLDELLRRLRRTMQLLDGHTNVLSLTDDILHWQQEHEYGPGLRPQSHLPVRWATDYFTELARYQAG